MSRRLGFSAELILVCNSLDARGIERVVSTLVNEWSRRGRKVSVITLCDRRRFYKLDAAVPHVTVDTFGLSRISDFLRWLATRLQPKNLSKLLLLNIIFGGFIELSYQYLNSTYFKFVHGCEAVMLRLAADESLRKRLGGAARKRVSEYDLPHAPAAWEAVLGLAQLEPEARPSV